MQDFLRSRLALASLMVLVLAGCREEEDAAQGGQAQRPPSQVAIITTKGEAVPFQSELPGRVAATRIAEVRPRVGGIVLERVFEQGANVEAGDPLFRIDPATYQVALESAKAGLARAEATQLQAQQDADRASALVGSNAVSRSAYDNAVASLAQAKADVALAQAEVRQAQLNLDYTTVTAPISGRIGRAQVTEGALVSANNTEALATIQQLDPVYADFQQPVSQLIKLQEALRNGELQQVEPNAARVMLVRDDGSVYKHPGKLLFSETTVDPTSGQVLLRCEFPNPDLTLLPGMYVRVRIEQGIQGNAIAVPNQAIQRDASGRSLVYVVGNDDTLSLRPVIASRVINDRTVIDQGLEPGERVVVDGFQKIGPGAPVQTTDWHNPLEQDGSAPAGEAGEGAGGEGGQATQTAPDGATSSD
ncbi:efflux RND transporter periplasmic adaptor subunit [Oceanicella sp. SM1341]|uniref:efflux RND transporter periplasmic adaptor subunit n=1 Tax=Oceanicella sp. SM1341 TaxID=1548889 RepID=UPI000E4E8BA1|nr:efflux RND transporter periplasmic adaptor subunit [Oceanicella sp. SM1341]